jgi:hypothetical protein
MNLNTLLNEFIDSLDKEMLKKKKAANRPIILKDGYISSEMSNGKIYRFEELTGSAMPDSPDEFEILDTETNIGNKYNALVVGVGNEVSPLYISSKSLPNLIEKTRDLFFSVGFCALTPDIGI